MKLLINNKIRKENKKSRKQNEIFIKRKPNIKG